MMIEKGSDTTLRQVRGGPDDGDDGELVETAVDGDVQHVTVRLADGRLVTFTETAAAGSNLPRELGS